MPFGVADVHPGQIGGEQRRLLAALTGLHLQHDVVAVVRIARGEQVGQMGVEFFDRRGEFVDFGGKGLVVGGQFAGGAEITTRSFQLAVGPHDRRQLRKPPADLAGLARVRVQVGVGELTFEVGMLGQDGINGRRVVGHVALLPKTRSDARPAACVADRASGTQLFVG